MRSLNVRPTLIPTLALAVWTLHAEDRDQEELSYWLSNMARHGYTTTEMQSVTGLDATGLEKSTFESTGATHASSDDTIIEVWPYPGGRHPRSGFLEGAIDPWRETKFSVFLPWDPNSYVVVDLPEALWDDGKLQFLAHTHIPTVWQEKGVELKRREWRRHANGRLTNRFYLPDGRVIRAEVSPTAAFVDMKLHFKNRSSRAIRGGRVQICVMLKGAAEFNAQTNNNKQFPPTGESSDGLTTNFTAVHSVDGNRSIVTLWTRMVKPWANSRCPCIHADPKFPDVEPGEEATLHGRLFFHEGPGLDEAIRQHRMELSRESTAPRTIEPRIVSNEVIWDRAHHNGASALVRFHDAWVCALREGKGDVSEDGVIRILTSTDDRRWQPHALSTRATQIFAIRSWPSLLRVSSCSARSQRSDSPPRFDLRLSLGAPPTPGFGRHPSLSDPRTSTSGTQSSTAIVNSSSVTRRSVVASPISTRRSTRVPTTL